MAAKQQEERPVPGPGGIPEAVPGPKTIDPRINSVYHKDVWAIYVFVVSMWIVLWAVFFGVLRYMEDPALVWVLAILGVLACVFNTVGMIQNVRRLGHERHRFYSQDLFWLDQKKAQRALRN